MCKTTSKTKSIQSYLIVVFDVSKTLILIMIISIISIMTFSSNYHTHKKNSNKTTRNYDIHYYSFIKSYYITLYNHSHHSRHRHHSHHSHHSHDTPVAHLQPRRHCKIFAGHVAWCLGMMSFLRDDEKLNSKDCNTQPKTNIIQHYFTQQLENYPTNFTQQKKTCFIQELHNSIENSATFTNLT